MTFLEVNHYIRSFCFFWLYSDKVCSPPQTDFVSYSCER